MKRSLLAIVAATAAIALLSGCSTSPEAPKDETASTAPSASESPAVSPGQSDENAPQPPAGADAALIAFVDVLKASCDKAIGEGSVAKSEGLITMTVPADKAIDGVANVDIANAGTEAEKNFLPPADMRTGKPMPFICSISASAYMALMSDGKSENFVDAADTWTWSEETFDIIITKGDLVSKFTTVFFGEGGEFKTNSTLTYGISDKDYETFKKAVANPAPETNN